jgi:hypothetical protein
MALPPYEIKRWQVIAEIVAALDRMYPSGTENRNLTSDDCDDIEDRVLRVLSKHQGRLWRLDDTVKP